MTPSCWEVLLATCSTLRQYIQERVSSISFRGACCQGALAQLSRGAWPQLRVLYLFFVHLLPEKFRALTLRHWPLLHVLNLTQSGFTGADWAQLTCGKWPHLHTLILTHDDLIMTCDNDSAQPD